MDPHSSVSLSQTSAGRHVALPPAIAALLPIMALVFVAYSIIGLAMPVVPLYVHNGLGLGAFVVGIVGGTPSLAALISRFWAGRYADKRGAKRAVVCGLIVAAAGGALYLVSLRFAVVPQISVAILLIGRALLGAADSFIITGALSLGMAYSGAQHTGTIMAWVGSALWAAFAIGAPAGTALYASDGFTAIALTTLLVPLAALLLVAPLRAPIATGSASNGAAREVAEAIFGPGVALALSGVGFGATTTFIALLYVEHRWGPVWVAFSLLSIAFMAGRLIFGDLPDRIGGAKVALACMLVETVGQISIWLAPSSAVALAGVTLSGLGFSMVYPALGVEAMRRAPAQNRALTMGAYTAFLDLALGLAGPGLGLIAARTSLNAVFLASSVIVVCAVPVAFGLAFPGRFGQANASVRAALARLRA